MPLCTATPYSKQFMEIYGDRLKGLTLPLINLYLIIGEHEGITMSELREVTKVGRSTLTNMIRVLGPVHTVVGSDGRAAKVGYGLVMLKMSLINRREREVVLSPKGKQIFKELKAKVEPSA